MNKIILIIILNILYGFQNDHLHNASLALKSGMYKDALVYVSISKKINPLDPNIYKIEGLLHEALGNREEAIQSWKNCLKYLKINKNLLKNLKII